jgi:hypothetical protein
MLQSTPPTIPFWNTWEGRLTVLSAVAPLQDSRRGLPLAHLLRILRHLTRRRYDGEALFEVIAFGSARDICQTYPYHNLNKTEQNKTRTHNWEAYSMPTKTRMNVPPVSVPRPNRLNSRRFLRRHKIASTTECRCDLHRSRLFASEARNGLPKRTQGLTTSAKPFLLLS